MIIGISKDQLREWSQNLIVRYVVLTLITAGVFAALTAFFNLAVETENIRALLTTLATAEASVLAIVFSVTVVALQLVVTRYSARLTSLFVKEPLFRTTFALFVGAIGFNLMVVYLLPVQSDRMTNAAVGIAFALAAVSTFALYRFIRLMILRSSPDELISVLINRELAPNEYLPKTVSDFRFYTVHPMRPLYRTVARAIELGEYQTAEQGIRGFQTVLIQTFEHLETEYSDEEAKQFAAVVSAEVLQEYFPPVLEQAYSHEQYDLVSMTIGEIKAIAQDGLNRGFTDVTEDAAEGLGDAFDSAPLSWEGNRIRNPVSEALVELSKVTATNADYSTFRAVYQKLDLQMTILLRRRPDANVTDRLVGDYYSQESVEIFEELLNRFGPKVNDQSINWISPTEVRKSTLPNEAVPLREFWRVYVNFTQTVLRYRVSEEEYPFVEGSIDDGWKQAADSAADAGVDGLATLFCVTTIQLAYRIDQLEEGHPGTWLNNLGRLRKDYDPAIVDRAFALLKTGEQPEGANITVQPWDPMSDEAENGILARLFSSSEEDPPFEEWIVNFENEVQERTEYLRERN